MYELDGPMPCLGHKDHPEILSYCKITGLGFIFSGRTVHSPLSHSNLLSLDLSNRPLASMFFAPKV